MANRKNKRAYLDDFQRDLNGNYQYCGAHCHYVGKTPRKTVLLRLWLLFPAFHIPYGVGSLAGLGSLLTGGWKKP